ncbi:MAG: hypothetical protein JXD23_15090 [Spirochaetales bacterium]|nr:hypothetical protein [Spirochaetales bacterium]
MDEMKFIRHRAEAMTDPQLLRCIGDGPDSYRPGVFELYLAEAGKRGLETAGLLEKAARVTRREELKKTITDYMYAAVPVFGVFLFFIRSVQLIRHRTGVKTIEEARRRHFIRQWRLSVVSFFTTAVLVGIIIFGGSTEVFF